MILTRHICRIGPEFHITHTNPSGHTVGADEVKNPWNRVIDSPYPLEPCPLCHDTSNRVDVVVIPGVHALKQPEERTPTFNPSAAPFNPSTAPFTPSRALVPRGFFDGIAGGIAGTVAPRPVPTAPRALVAVPHKAGKACPEAHSECHWHHSQWCHERFYTCAKALRAIKAAAMNHSGYTGAVEGWNAMHAKCVRSEDPEPCNLHSKIYADVYGHDIAR
ncbi:hypothetical protein D6D12_00233 [Aureobasidium pullulans]|uniref:Uncharacterized protein n=1 Tax=Aureobasidium pullulans TaxID=5580 RepID=A0AB74K7K5_AURPU|nr:hypothetical protein D6D12_00233 [Aureobasidium pullulans]THX51492.1 hypothetical protein D6D11_05016 [Aureobasidium pullulans]